MSRIISSSSSSLLRSSERSVIFFSTRQGWWNGRHRLDVHGVIRGDWELHWAREGRPWGVEEDRTGFGDLRLFDLERDPFQREDVSADHPQIAARLRQLVLEDLERARRRKPKYGVGVGRGGARLLSELGYAGPEEE